LLKYWCNHSNNFKFEKPEIPEILKKIQDYEKEESLRQDKSAEKLNDDA